MAMIIARTMVSYYGIWCMETTFDVFVTNTPALFFIYWLFTTVLCLNAIKICSLD